MFDFLTPDIFNGLVWASILIGGALAILRLYRDLTRPLPHDRDSSGPPGPENRRPPQQQDAEDC
jgi:hypothetical protein